MNVVFENADFLAVDKPPGWLTVPGRMGRHEPAERPCLVDELRKKWPGVLTVHRLDAEVTGIVLFARSPLAHRAASLWFEQHTIGKFYEAWTEGKPPERGSESALWESRIVRGKKRAFEADHGKLSRTRVNWQREASRAGGGRVQVWSVEPLTGRSHQIRFELAKHGHPIVGDALYGAKSPWREGEIALRAVKLVFPRGQAEGLAALPETLAVTGLADA